MSRLSYAYPSIALATFLVLLNAASQPAMLQPSNWPATVSFVAPFILISMAQVAPVVSGNGNIDLSVGPVASFVGAVVVTVLVPAGVDQVWTLVPLALALGAAVGVLNGVLVAYVRIPAIVATLGAYLVFSALAVQILPNPGGVAPEWLAGWSRGTAGSVSGMLVVLVLAAVAWMALQRTAFRRNLLATGGDARSAYTAGVPVDRVRLTVFVIAGLLSATAGLAFVSALGAGDPTVGNSFTLVSLAAVALGGVSLAGGRGGMLGAAAGGVMLFMLQNAIGQFGLNVFFTQVAYGIALVLALVANFVSDRWRHRARST